MLKNEKGQAMVELAIILPILLIILMGIFEFSRVMNAYLVLNHSSKEGARQASIGSEDTQIVEKINNSSNPLDISKLIINISPSKINRLRGSAVTVKVGYDVHLMIPIIQGIVPNPIHIQAQTTMRVE